MNTITIPRALLERVQIGIDSALRCRLAGMPTVYLEQAQSEIAAALSAPSPQPSPIDMVLHCPKCGMQHVDDDPDVQKVHRLHTCLPRKGGCGHIWRPADVPTNGVQAVKTAGKADSPLAQPSPEPVAWRWRSRHEDEWKVGNEPPWYADRPGYEKEPLYASPLPQPEPVAQPAQAQEQVEPHTLDDDALKSLAVTHGFGTWEDAEETKVIWFDGNPLPLLKAVVGLVKPAPDAITDPWRLAVDDALVSHGLDCTGPYSDPAECVRRLVDTAVQMALDPAIAITDSMVEAGARAILGLYWDSLNNAMQALYRDQARACLTAALGVPVAQPAQAQEQPTLPDRITEQMVEAGARAAFALSTPHKNFDTLIFSERNLVRAYSRACITAALAARKDGVK